MLRPWNRHQFAPLPIFDESPTFSPFASAAHKPLFIIFLTAWLASLTGEVLSIDAAREWPLAAWGLVAAALATTLNGFARRLPWQNVIAASLLIGAAGGGFVLWSARFAAGGEAMVSTPGFGGPRLDWRVPALWVVVLINARGVARLILRPWRQTRFYGLWVIAVASVLASVFDRAWPGAGRVGGVGLFEVSGSLLIRAVAAFVVLTAAAPWLLNKRPVAQPSDSHPLVVWLLLSVFAFVAGHAGSGRAAGALLLAVSVAGFVLAVRGIRWQPPAPDRFWSPPKPEKDSADYLRNEVS